MAFISFRRADGTAAYGRIEGDRVLDCAISGAPASLRAAIAAGPLDELAGGEAIPLAGLDLLPVIPDPAKILCVGHNYESHRQETGRARVEHPSIFTRFADTLIADGDAIVLPRVSGDLDFEGELAVVIGRGGRFIPEADAMDHVAGYACFMDASIRDWQWHTTQFAPGKNFPGTGGFGPRLVTPEEAGDLADVRVTTRLNDAVVQDQPIRDMIFSVARIIAYVSAFTPLSPGDVIATGTPGGVGAKRQPPLWMKAGDRVEVSIGPIGTLTNHVVAEADVRGRPHLNNVA